MMDVLKGSADITTYVKMVDSAAGTPETGLTITAIDATYTRMRAAAVKNDLTALGAANSAHADNQGIEVDATNAPGLYRVDWPDAAFATGADKVILTVTCAGCDPAHLHVNLVNYNSQDGVRLGLTALPNAAADTAGGLIISDAGGLDADAQRSDVAAILVDTGTTLDARIPAALVSGRMDSSVGAMAANVMTAAAAAADLTTELQSGLATAANLAMVAGYLDTEIADIKAKTDNLPADPADASDIAAAFTTINTKLDTIDDLIDTEVAAIKADTAAILLDTGTDGVVLNAAGLATDAVNEIADGILNRDMSAGTDSGSPSFRTMRQALRFLRNKWDVVAGTLTVRKEDDSTTSWTSAVTGTAGADPVTGSDPA